MSFYVFPVAAFALIYGAYLARENRFDMVLLGVSGTVTMLHAILWQAGYIAEVPILALFSLAVGPQTVYILGVIFLFRFFFTPFRGYVKGIYLIGGLLALSPIIFLILLAFGMQGRSVA